MTQAALAWACPFRGQRKRWAGGCYWCRVIEGLWGHSRWFQVTQRLWGQPVGLQAPPSISEPDSPPRSRFTEPWGPGLTGKVVTTALLTLS